MNKYSLNKQKQEVFVRYEHMYHYSPETKKLILLLTTRCNNNCIFCLQGGDVKTGVFMPFEAMKLILSEGKRLYDLDQVVLTGGEPTIHPNFLDVINFANDVGYYVRVVTNGRAFASMKFLHQAVKNGLKEITLSLHDVDEKMFDFIMRVKGAYRQVWKAVENIHKLRKYYTLHISVNIGIFKTNYTRLFTLVKRIVEDYGFDENFNLISPIPYGNAEKYQNLIIPDYNEIEPYLIKTLEYLYQKRIIVWVLKTKMKYMGRYTFFREDSEKMLEKINELKTNNLPSCPNWKCEYCELKPIKRVVNKIFYSKNNENNSDKNKSSIFQLSDNKYIKLFILKKSSFFFTKSNFIDSDSFEDLKRIIFSNKFSNIIVEVDDEDQIINILKLFIERISNKNQSNLFSNLLNFVLRVPYHLLFSPRLFNYILKIKTQNFENSSLTIEVILYDEKNHRRNFQVKRRFISDFFLSPQIQNIFLLSRDQLKIIPFFVLNTTTIADLLESLNDSYFLKSFFSMNFGKIILSMPNLNYLFKRFQEIGMGLQIEPNYEIPDSKELSNLISLIFELMNGFSFHVELRNLSPCLFESKIFENFNKYMRRNKISLYEYNLHEFWYKSFWPEFNFHNFGISLEPWIKEETKFCDKCPFNKVCTGIYEKYWKYLDWRGHHINKKIKTLMKRMKQ